MRILNRRRLATGAFVGLVSLAACGVDYGRPPVEVPGGDPEAGALAIGSIGCATCHAIPGIEGADATVGPPLDEFGRQRLIAGELPNEPANLIKWLMDPQEIEPGTAMPDMDIREDVARDIAAYLYTLR